MEAELICQENNKRIFEGILSNYGIITVENSNLLIIDTTLFDQVNTNISSYDLVIQFNPNNIQHLINLLQGSQLSNVVHNHLIGKNGENIILLTIKDIVYIYAQGNDTYANMKDGSFAKIKYKLYQLEEGLLPNYFIRINKSEIINIHCIKSISPMFRGNLVLNMLFCKKTLDVSRKYLKEFKERLGII